MPPSALARPVFTVKKRCLTSYVCIYSRFYVCFYVNFFKQDSNTGTIKMSRERQLLCELLAWHKDKNGTTSDFNYLMECVEECLSKPEQEQFNPDWLSYRQGKEDAKQTPLSNERIINEGWHECRNKLKDTIFHSEIFMMGVEWAEKQHGIGE